MRETLKNAFAQLKGNKLRTFLTMLGMLIGIGAVIIILSLGEGMKSFINGQFSGVGKGTIQIAAMQDGEEYLLTSEDMEVLEQIPQVETTMQIHDNYTAITTDYHKEEKVLMAIGIPANIEKVMSLNIRYGRMITEKDEDLRSHVIIVEDNYSKVMFNHTDPAYALGKSIDITIGGEVQSFEIVGIAKTQYPSAMPESMIMPIVYFPFATFDQYILDGQHKSYEAYVVIKDGYEAKDYSKAIGKIIDKRHGGDDAYLSMSLMEATNVYNDILDKMNLFISIVAAISLLVGGIGIMNIMLVTVRERTREIGIRKALGATDRQILIQFLVEALILTILGGIGGMLLGYLGSFLIAAALNITARLTGGMIIFSVGTSSVIGIIFGVYPAYKAARLDPVEALREE